MIAATALTPRPPLPLRGRGEAHPGCAFEIGISFTAASGRVTAIDLVADRERLDRLDGELLPREGE